MNIKSNLEAAAAEISTGVQQDVLRASSGLQHFIDKWRMRLTNPAEASYQLGTRLLAEENYTEAKFRFKFTLWRKPNHAKALHNLAICHFALGEVKEGVALVQQAIRNNPKDEYSRYLLATIEDGKYAEGYEPHTTPPEMIKNEFRLRASQYEAEEIADFGYAGHYAVYEVFNPLPYPTEELYWPCVLDAGCGTGLLGTLVKPLIKRLHGVDLSPEMLAIAAELRGSGLGRKIYDLTMEADVRSYLLHVEQPMYHAILAANLAPLMGGLSPFLDGAMRALHAGGYVIFSYRPAADKQAGYHLLAAERRFAHSETYIRQVAEKSGFTFISITEKKLYGDEEENIPCHVVCLQKPAS